MLSLKALHLWLFGSLRAKVLCGDAAEYYELFYHCELSEEQLTELPKGVE